MDSASSARSAATHLRRVLWPFGWFAFLLVAVGCGGRQGQVSPRPNVVLSTHVLEALGSLRTPGTDPSPLSQEQVTDRELAWIRLNALPLDQLAMSQSRLSVRLREVDVVCVLDDHRLGGCRRAAREVLRLTSEHWSTNGAQPNVRLLLLEAIPRSAQETVDELQRKSPERAVPGIMKILQAEWPWPIRQYEDLIRFALLTGWRLVGVGSGPRMHLRMREPDRERRPFRMLSGLTQSGLFDQVNTNVANALSAAGGARAVVLCGEDHLFGPSSATQHLSRAGRQVVRVGGCVPSWEHAVQRRFGRQGADQWLRLGPGIWRGPLISAEDLGEICETARIDERVQLESSRRLLGDLPIRLLGGTAESRQAVLRELSWLGSGRDLIAAAPALRELTSSSSGSLRAAAVTWIGRTGLRGTNVVELLIGLLGDPESEVRLSAARALSWLPVNTKRHVSVLQALIVGKSGELGIVERANLLVCLANSLEARGTVIRGLLELIKDHTQLAISVRAPTLLARYDPATEEVLEVLRQLSSDARASVRVEAQNALLLASRLKSIGLKD